MQDTVIRLMHNIASIRELSDYKCRKYILLTVKPAFLDMVNRSHSACEVQLNDDIMELWMRDELLEERYIPELSAKLAVDQLKNSLMSREWMLLEAKYILVYSQEELGRLLGISPDSVRMTLCRARESARRILHAKGYGQKIWKMVDMFIFVCYPGVTRNSRGMDIGLSCISGLRRQWSGAMVFMTPGRHHGNIDINGNKTGSAA